MLISRLTTFTATLSTFGLIATAVITGSVASGATVDTACWDQYDLAGSQFYGTITPQDLPVNDCTPARTCKSGYGRAGEKIRLLVPHGADPRNACVGATTSTTVPKPPIVTTPRSSTTTTTTVPRSSPGGTVPAGVQFVESFDNDTGMDRFDKWVFQRNADIHNYLGWGGGKWTGDHDTSCGGPDTQRTLAYTAGEAQAKRVATSFYTCKDHMMTSMGDVDGYSIVAFSPKQTFKSVKAVSFDINLTELGSRQWWKIGVLSTSKCPALDLRCMYSDISSSDIPSTEGAGRLIATWGGQGGYPAKLSLLNAPQRQANPSPNDKMTRHPVTLRDNGNGTVTFTVAGVSTTGSGSFPACPCRVVFYDHNYTPDKDGTPIGHTWHWDNIVVR